MKILSGFQDIIDNINKLEAEKKELAHKAIDMSDWTEAQNVLKKTQSEITWLKTWKGKLLDLKREYETSELCNAENSQLSSEDQPIIDEPAPTEVTTLQPKEDKKTDNEDNNNVIETQQEKTDTPTFEDSVDEQNSENWYTLDYDYTNTKIKAVLINNKKYYVKDMTEALMTVCEWLYQFNSEFFIKMLNAKFVHGSRNRYLSATPFDVLKSEDESENSRKFKKLSNAEIYVWTNTNSNLKANLMANMLLYYNLPDNSVLLAIREDYNPTERSYSSRETHQSDEPNPTWSEDISDDNEYSTPVVSQKSKNNQQESQPSRNTVSTSPDSIINEDVILNSDEVIEACENLILKSPFQMSLAFLSEEVGEMFSVQESSARSIFQNPQRLSNGLWVETQGIKKAQLYALEKYCKL